MIRTLQRKTTAVALALLIVLGMAATASAADFVVTVGGTETLQVKNTSRSDYAAITNLTSSDPSIATATFAGNMGTVYGVKDGNVTITASYIDAGDSNQNKTQTFSVTVGSGAISQQGSTVNVAVRGTATVGPYGRISSITSSNQAVAIASVDSTSTTATVVGVSAGNAQLTLVVYDSTSSTTSRTVTIPVVVGSSTSTATTGTNTTANLTVGQTAEIGTYAVVENLLSSDTSVISTRQDNGRVLVSALKAGTSTVSFNARTSSTGTSTAYRYTITVTGSGTATAPTGSGSTTGSVLAFKTDSRSLAKGKSFRLTGMTLDGKTVKAGDLLWMTTDASKVSVNRTTGTFKTVASGSAYLVAVDPETGACDTIKIIVNS